jgi:AraC-like DNA-binding protein
MDGLTLTGLVKSTSLTTHIPVILLTARTSADNRVQGLTSGANDYLTKPFNLQELQLRVANWFNHQQTIRQDWYSKFTLPNSEEPPVSLPDKPVEDPFLLEIYQILDRELDNASFTVDQMAAEMKVSTRTLHRKVTALTTINASILIRSYRLYKAAILLQEGYAVSEVANRVGFEGLSYFSKCFKDQFSVSPSQYTQSQSR